MKLVLWSTNRPVALAGLLECGLLGGQLGRALGDPRLQLSIQGEQFPLGPLAFGDVPQKRDEGLRAGVMRRADLDIDDPAVPGAVPGLEDLEAPRNDRLDVAGEFRRRVLDIQIDDRLRQQLIPAVTAHPAGGGVHVQQTRRGGIHQPEAIAGGVQHGSVAIGGLL